MMRQTTDLFVADAPPIAGLSFRRYAGPVDLPAVVEVINLENRADDVDEVETVEGLAEGTKLHPLQAAFADHGGSQCGYCTPGMLMTAKALLDGNANPTRDQIKEAISGNLCRCTGYQQIWESVEAAARALREAKP